MANTASFVTMFFTLISFVDPPIAITPRAAVLGPRRAGSGHRGLAQKARAGIAHVKTPVTKAVPRAPPPSLACRVAAAARLCLGHIVRPCVANAALDSVGGAARPLVSAGWTLGAFGGINFIAAPRFSCFCFSRKVKPLPAS